ncbi:MAG: ABC transporter permease [Calditrichaeota bacterium]|jgi:peptide/nickel transport system permease protein|nr:ABC transporter permease [Calditrichota bacterium]MBT7615661.1 ABC transporter permease [Calditrichota bacterium]MBT7787708.1 ABC transporter permease [Calditrichota bacterium]
MAAYILKRILFMIPTIFGITIVAFLIIHLAPGDPAAMKARAGEGMVEGVTEEAIQKTRELYGLDKPLHIQYYLWLKRIATLDLGESIKFKRPVWDVIMERIPVSLRLALTSLFLAYLISIPIGIYSATHQYSRVDTFVTLLLFILYSLPSFWVATMLIVFLGGGDFLDIFPVFGLASIGAEKLSFWARFWDTAWHLVLPVFCMTYASLAVLSRYMRTAMLEVIRQDYITTARAKGLSENVVIYKHALRNSLIPIITLLASLLPATLGGSIIIETIFTIPGMGQLVFEAILARDYPIIMGELTIVTFLTLFGILVADILYSVVDPRIAYDRSSE